MGSWEARGNMGRRMSMSVESLLVVDLDRLSGSWVGRLVAWWVEAARLIAKQMKSAATR